ncbi:type I DNA topoisomerase [SAR202 cluster bacterium AD-802-E10_MRT_200m]|nr:type I DNA topoisomerase [SAR202 cluster bacterium AD-802-E10_MRT_200m]MQF82780.1 type I DNA topoisomerase [SAR202 cluster bacterium AD-802-E10_MRT_200m]
MTTKNSGKDLVIVESPTKARTIERIIGDKYTAIASLGHVRDLPVSRLGVTVNERFIPEYIVGLDKRKVVADVKRLAKEANIVYLATDPDREGEAISWHLARAAEIPMPRLRRVVFHEITPEAVKEAFDNPRDIDIDLVNAQQARRILDRLVGYKISPLISKKMRWWGLSAGRVQSAALRIVVEKEQAIEAFTPQEYWSITAMFSCSENKNNTANNFAQDLKVNGKSSPENFKAFSAELHSLKGEKDRIALSSQEQSSEVLYDLKHAIFTVDSVKSRDIKSKPSPPFITSTLQQEAWRKLRFPTRKTMLIAQQLFEGVSLSSEGPTGLITYMRTDSTHVSESAVKETREFIINSYGKDFLSPKPRVYRTKSKSAQEAHEAIRPTSVERIPSNIMNTLQRDQFRLYDLIWKRFVASQMSDSTSERTTIDINGDCNKLAKSYLFRANGTKLKFSGYQTLYLESTDNSEREKDSIPLPNLSAKSSLTCEQLKPLQHFTQPPARFTEASLVGALEEIGVGRPSTYASIVSTIQERKYVKRENGRLFPLPLGTVVNGILKDYFDSVMDPSFTAQMEEELDGIARGEADWQTVLGDFYRPFVQNLEIATQNMPRIDIPTGEFCELCERPMILKKNRWGRSFLSCSGFPDCREARPLTSKLGIGCPRCDGELVERKPEKGRRRTIFYGCTKYPNCEFSSNQKPLPEPCTECNGLMVRKNRSQSQCIECKQEQSLAS